MTVNQSQPLVRLAFWSALALAIVDRLLLVISFGAGHTGTDDVVFWYVASDMAHGIFKEPFLYGQNYNPALESLAAVPLLWIGVPLWWAMPVVTSFLAMAPFLSFGIWLQRKGQFLPALVFVCIPVLLPVEWGIMTTVTRGFVTGLAVLALLPWTDAINDRRLREMTAGSLLFASLVFNPNAVLLALPFAVHLAWSHRDPLRSILYMVLGALPLAGVQAWAMRFYAMEPERIVHRIDDWRLTFHPLELIPEAVQQLDLHLAHLTPAWWSNGHVILYLLALLAAYHGLRGRKAHAWAIATVFPLMVLAFAFPKVHDGYSNVFFPLSRMHLALPLLLGWSTIDLAPGRRMASTAPAYLALALALTLLVLYKAERTGHIIERELATQQPLPVRELPMSTVQEDVEALTRAAAREEAHLVVFMDDEASKYRGQLMTYAGPLLSNDLPPTLYARTDRRYEHRIHELSTIRPTILFVGGEEANWEALPDGVAWHAVDGLPLLDLRCVRRNDLALKDLLVLLGYPDRDVH